MKNGPKLLCLDLGTSACKGALIDARGRTSAAARETYSLVYEPNGWIEQEPEVIWTAMAGVVAQLAAGGDEIVALSLSAQMSSHLLAGPEGKPLTRFISWADQRADRESRELAEDFTPDELATAWGARLNPGPSWALPKLKWWRRHQRRCLIRRPIFCSRRIGFWAGFAVRGRRIFPACAVCATRNRG